MPKLQKPKGFLLFEVILSVLIISIGLVFVVKSFASSILAVKKFDYYFKAADLAEQEEVNLFLITKPNEE